MNRRCPILYKVFNGRTFSTWLEAKASLSWNKQQKRLLISGFFRFTPLHFHLFSIHLFSFKIIRVYLRIVEWKRRL